MPIELLHQWHSDRQQDHLQRVTGLVTAQRPGHWVTLQAGRAFLIAWSTATNRVEIGDELEVAGFVSQGAGLPSLHRAQWRRTDSRQEISPRTLAGEGDFETMPVGELVRFRATLKALGGGNNKTEAIFQLGSALLALRPPADAPPDMLQVGAIYVLTGVRGPREDATTLSGVAETFWPAGAPGMQLLYPANRPGEAPFSWRDLWWVALFSAVMAGWWWQHRRQRALLDEMEATLAFNRARLVQAENEQARIARDLHDGVIQSIYAVGMRIEECRRLAVTAPATAGEKLATTSEALNHVIRDMRGFLTGLESASIQGRELKTALKSVLLGLGDAAANRIVLQIDTHTASALTSKEATELFHICKEALSNSLRHGRADRVEICLETTPTGRRVEISDNGCGFDAAEVTVGSRGLQNMQARAKNLAGHLQMVTSPGRGTRLIVALPNS